MKVTLFRLPKNYRNVHGSEAQMKRHLIYKNHNASEDVLHLFSIEQQRLLFEGNIEFCMLRPFHLQQDTVQNPFCILYDNSEPLLSVR